MYSAAQLQLAMNPAPTFIQAKILDLDFSTNTARVIVFDMTGGIHEKKAQIALAFGGNLGIGDEVLLAGNDTDTLYIIGMLTQNTVKSVISSKDGSFVTLNESEGSSLFQICSEKGELLIEYDSLKRTTRVRTPDKEIEFIAPTGNMKFSSHDTIQFAAEKIQLQGQSEVSLETSNSRSQTSSSFILGQFSSQLSSSEIIIKAKRGKSYLDELQYVGNTISSKIKNIRMVVEKIETTAVTILHKARNFYTAVEQLTQLKTGRLRTLVDATYHLKSQRMIVKAAEDVKINAEKIHLG
jgi:hypothetical protein